ncbi:GMC oxidoreductase [Zasmidium cellare ATCC 36951]|uniref:GMC oxidoreductase n=1 Tax=Zasmidium cellare ATCC 36951 TaxID=1080233 RepID=A0A6A6CGJ8_ZASCE|nr:GMC oxidoreductase [Zasmidium cellare ATCC 36951]KAF2165298.1 GMC oxidoreductase [Zasmidium cellare ATCC 36951]
MDPISSVPSSRTDCTSSCLVGSTGLEYAPPELKPGYRPFLLTTVSVAKASSQMGQNSGVRAIGKPPLNNDRMSISDYEFYHLEACSSKWVTIGASQEYEFIVIGSGAGGGPLAANLARTGHTVLLLEARTDNGDSMLQRVPSFSDFAAESDEMAWAFYVDHYTNTTQAYRDNKYTWRHQNGSIFIGTGQDAGDAEPLGIIYLRGATLGGSTQVNGMCFTLPPDAQWDELAALTGDDSWNSTSMRTIFEQLEACDYLPNGTAGHGFDGYIHSNQLPLSLLDLQPGLRDVLGSVYGALGQSKPNSTTDLINRIGRDMNRLDPIRYENSDLYTMVIDQNADHVRTGARDYIMDTLQATHANGSRRYPGLTISTQSFATRVLFANKTTESTRPRATGVEYVAGESVYKADLRFPNRGARPITPVQAIATREVIVSGGAFNTPQILKLSGSAPARIDLPAVGQNLQDNYEGGITVEAARDFTTLFTNCTFGDPGDPCLAEFTLNHTGPYTIGSAWAALLFGSSVATTPDTDIYALSAPLSTFWWSLVKMRPQGRGSVKLRSADPFDTPLINFEYFANGGAHDLQALQDAVKFIQAAMNSKGGGYSPFTTIAPEPSVSIQQGIKDYAFGHHCACNCAMGPANSSAACVDSQLRVHGVEGLRVVDTSVFPGAMGAMGAFPMLPTFMVGLKAFRFIRAEVEGAVLSN